MIKYFSFYITKGEHISSVKCNTKEGALKEALEYFDNGYDISEIIDPDSIVVKQEQKHEH